MSEEDNNTHYLLQCQHCLGEVKFNKRDHPQLADLWEHEFKIYCNSCRCYSQYQFNTEDRSH